MPRRLDVLISGAGIVGPALAYWTARHGHRVTIVERGEQLRTGGHVVDIRGTALDVIERMGLGAAVRANRTALRTLSMVRGAGPRTYDLYNEPGRAAAMFTEHGNAKATALLLFAPIGSTSMCGTSRRRSRCCPIDSRRWVGVPGNCLPPWLTPMTSISTR